MIRKLQFRRQVRKVTSNVAKGAMTVALVATLGPTAALATPADAPSALDATSATGGQSVLAAAASSSYDLSQIADGTYTARAAVSDQDPAAEDSFEGYDVSVSVTVANHQITNVSVDTATSDVPRRSRSYFEDAIEGAEGVAGVPAQMVAKQSTGIDIVSGATVTSKVIKEAVDSALAQAMPATPEYVYGYSGLTWAEYYANETGVANHDNDEANPVVDSHGEYDKGGFDVVTRATTNHGLHRGSYQGTAVIETESGRTYTVNSWNGRSEFVDADGVAHSYNRGTIDGTEQLKDYDVLGLKYVPVAIKASDLDAYKATGHTFIENGSTLAGGFSENSIQAYTATANVDANTNGLKTVTLGTNADGTTSVSYSAAKRDGTTSGLAGQDLKTIDLASLNPNLRSGSAVGSYGETIRIDLAGEGYGALGAALQSVDWTYYGDDSTCTKPVATYGTKFAADNWMHRMMGIQLGLTDSYRAPLSSLPGKGVGYWKITTHALGYADASYSFQVTADNIAAQDLASDATKAQLQALVDQAGALTSNDYTEATWATLATELQESKDLLAKETVYEAEASEQVGHLQSAIDGLEKAAVTSWKSVYDSIGGVDTSKGTYDVVTSATNFKSRHARDIASIVHKAVSEGATTGLDGVKLTGEAAAVTPKLGSAEYQYDSSYGTGEFVICPDDTVEGYTWNDYFDHVYAATISDGTTTVGTLPWQDWYGEHSTRGYHYNKFEIALNNGTSIGSNAGNVDRFAAFYDEGASQIKPGKYTVTIYSEGYAPLVASDITVLPTYAGEVTATNPTSANPSIAISGLPADIENATVSASHTEGHGRGAVTTRLADGAAIGEGGVVAFDASALASLPNAASIDVTISSANYAPIELTVAYAGSRVERLAGSAESGAAGTAAAIAAEAFAGSTADTVVIARNDDYHDALAGSGLAGALGAPILLTDRGGLSQAAADEIGALGATKAVILGGTSAVSDQVRADLADLGLEVDRLGGADVYGTSMAINQRLVSMAGANAGQAIVVNPTTFADALSISGWAYANHVPVMLQTWGDTAAERGFGEDAEAILAGRHLIVCGGEQAVSSASVSAIDPGFERLGGETIYDTSLAIAGWELEHGMSAKDVTVASAIPDYNGVDALAGSALAGRRGGVTLLAQSNDAFGWYDGGEAAIGFIEAHASDIQGVHVLGGEVASTPALYDAIREALGEDVE